MDDPIEVVVTETLSQAVRRQADKIARLLALIEEAANEIEDEAKNRYAGRLHYPSMQSRYERDMDIVRRMRVELKDKGL
jgi:tRNA A37 threonylcarbamoyltransferase TsaD